MCVLGGGRREDGALGGFAGLHTERSCCILGVLVFGGRIYGLIGFDMIHVIFVLKSPDYLLCSWFHQSRCRPYWCHNTTVGKRQNKICLSSRSLWSVLRHVYDGPSFIFASASLSLPGSQFRQPPPSVLPG